MKLAALILIMLLLWKSLSWHIWFFSSPGVQLPPDAMQQEDEMSSLEVEFFPPSSTQQQSAYKCLHDHDQDRYLRTDSYVIYNNPVSVKVEIVDLKSVTSRTSSSGVSWIGMLMVGMWVLMFLIVLSKRY